MPAAAPQPDLADVLRSASRLQQLVPDAVLVGGSAAALHAGHRVSFDHHVLSDLADRSRTTGSVLTELVLALAEPSPRDPAVIDELPRYKGLDPTWHEWSSVVAACQSLALDLSGAR